MDKRQFLDDLQRIYILYHRHGYFAFELESYEIQSRDGDVRITLRVSEGAPTLVDAVTLEGFESIDDEDLEAELRDRLPMKAGAIFKEDDLIASRNMLESGFKNRGFAFAQVLLEYRIRKAQRTATVTYSVDPGDVYYFGQIDVAGAGVAGIYCVAVLPHARRQGIGAAITFAPLRDARNADYQVAVLQASKMGKGVYREIGFQEYCTFALYTWSEAEQQGPG